MKQVVVLIALVSFSACKGRVVKTSETVNEITNKNYREALGQFVSSLVDHFPDELHSSRNLIDYSLDEENKEIGMTLYEYDLADEKVQKILSVAKQKAAEVYNSSDTCLLVINQDRVGSFFAEKKAISATDYSDSTQRCLVDLLPIPNFSGFSLNQKPKTPNFFNIYVFETGQDQLETQYEIEPNVNLPPQWKHGFSKGIAINENKGVVIYWGTTW